VTLRARTATQRTCFHTTADKVTEWFRSYRASAFTGAPHLGYGARSGGPHPPPATASARAASAESGRPSRESGAGDPPSSPSGGRGPVPPGWIGPYAPRGVPYGP